MNRTGSRLMTTIDCDRAMQTLSPSITCPWTALPPLSEHLGQRWIAWATSRRGAKTLDRWAERFPPLVGCHPAQLLAPLQSAHTDAVQAALVSLAQGAGGGDAPSVEAAQLLLVQMRPGLRRLTADTARRGGGQRHRSAAQEVQSTFVESIYRHDLGRRPKKIAANLLLDTRQRVTRSSAKRLPPSDAAPSGTRLDSSLPAADATTLAVRSVLVSELVTSPGIEHPQTGTAGTPVPNTAEIVYRAWFLGEKHREIAADLGVDAQVISTRLHRVRNRIRPLLAEAAA